MSEFRVTILDEVEVTDAVSREPNRIDILVSDVIAISDRITFPRRIAIESIEAPRGRDADVILIHGQGFSVDPTNNRVTFSGFAGTVTAATESQLTVTVPFTVAFLCDFFVTVTAETPPWSGVQASRRWWSKLDPETDLADQVLVLERPGPSEDVETDRPSYADATDWARLLTVVEFLLRDVQKEAGGIATRDDTGLVPVQERNAVDYGKDGQVLVVDPAEPEGIAFGWVQDVTLPFGGRVIPNPGAPVMLRAGGCAVGSVNTQTEHSPLANGTIDLLWLLVKRLGVTDTIDRIRLLVNGAQVHDSGAGLGLTNNAVFRADLAVMVVATDTIEIEVTKVGVVDNFGLVGGCRILVR